MPTLPRENTLIMMCEEDMFLPYEESRLPRSATDSQLDVDRVIHRPAGTVAKDIILYTLSIEDNRLHVICSRQ